jgi:hypothetical protein
VKNFILKLFFLTLSSNLLGHSNKSFLKFDPIQTLIFIDPTNLLSRNYLFFEILPFYIQNTNDSEISNYFLPFNQCALLTSENLAANQAIKDVNATNLNINYESETFESITHFSPKYKNTGILFHINSFLTDKTWIDLILPFSKLKTEMNLKETVINPGQTLVPTSVANVTEAFKQISWNYGKIDGSRCAGGLNDIDLKIGSSLENNNFSLYPFIGVIIPTGTKITAEYVFEPVIGNNRHFTIQSGLINFYQMCPSRNPNISFYLDLILFYSFKNRQLRMLDLIEKEWSRYMIVYDNPKQALIAFNNSGDPEAGDKGQAGINAFTQKVYVSPGLSFQSTFRAWFIRDCIKNEFGMSMYFREKENLSIENNNNFSSIALVGAAGAGTTTNAKTINYNFIGTKSNNMADAKINENEYANLNYCDIDTNSGSAPAALSLTFFYKIQYSYKKIKINIATSYKFSKSNSAINLISIWGGLTYAF